MKVLWTLILLLWAQPLNAGGGMGRILSSERSHSRTLLDDVNAKVRSLTAFQAEVASLKDHINSRLQTLFIFTDRLTQLKHDEIRNDGEIKLLREKNFRLAKAKRELLQSALLGEPKH